MQPQNSNDKFDFILKDNQTAKKNVNAPIANLPKPIAFVVIGVVGLIIILIFYSVFFGNKKPSYQPIIESVGRAQEIVRVTKEVEQQTKDANTKILASTVDISLTSEQTQLSAYLVKNKHVVSPKTYLVYKDSSIDSQLQTAAQNNNLEAAYVTYLKQSLAAYQISLRAAYKTSGPNGKAIIQEAFNSVDTILSGPQFK